MKADKFPVGAFVDEQVQSFTSKQIQLQKNDLVYLFSDGFADQFGGDKGKKFKYKTT
ncbi:MAG: SpoIIE family protein phosphatase [Bacteroidetes bacterium]|nr:SpoIIE family protein phosphatase [Bacteroidota bacterium]